MWSLVRNSSINSQQQNDRCEKIAVKQRLKVSNNLWLNRSQLFTLTIDDDGNYNFKSEVGLTQGQRTRKGNVEEKKKSCWSDKDSKPIRVLAAVTEIERRGSGGGGDWQITNRFFFSKLPKPSAGSSTKSIFVLIFFFLEYKWEGPFHRDGRMGR